MSYRNQAFIGGKFAPSLTGKTFDCINPATGQVLTKVAACEQADIDAAVKAARGAFRFCLMINHINGCNLRLVMPRESGASSKHRP